MVFIVFSCTNLYGEYVTCNYGDTDIESCFDTLNVLVASGWQLHDVCLSEAAGKQIKLPVEAFDGEPTGKHLVKLQRTWAIILRHPNYFFRAKKAREQARYQLEERKRRIEDLFERMDILQAHILETKARWGVV